MCPIKCSNQNEYQNHYLVTGHEMIILQVNIQRAGVYFPKLQILTVQPQPKKKRTNKQKTNYPCMNVFPQQTFVIINIKIIRS